MKAKPRHVRGWARVGLPPLMSQARKEREMAEDFDRDKVGTWPPEFRQLVLDAWKEQDAEDFARVQESYGGPQAGLGDAAQRVAEGLIRRVQPQLGGVTMLLGYQETHPIAFAQLVTGVLRPLAALGKLGLLQEAVALWESLGAQVETREMATGNPDCREFIFRIILEGKVFYIEAVLADDEVQADNFEAGETLVWPDLS